MWGSVQADRSLVSSGPAGASALGHCGVQFRLMGVWSPQDLWRGGAVEGKVRKLGREFLCVADAECVCLQRTQDWKSLMWKVVGF